MRLSEAWKYRAAIEKASRSLPDGELLEVPSLAPVWDSGQSYASGDRVGHTGVLYRCLQAHRAQADWSPAAAPSLWARVLVPEENLIPAWVQPDSANPYRKGDKVRHNAQVWESTIDNNVWEPGVYGWAAAEE